MSATILSRLVLVVVALLFLSFNAQAAGEEITIVSESGFQPGQPMNFIIAGTPGMSFNIRIIDSAQNIVGGRDAALNETGGYVYGWTPTQDGEYNVTVTYATGLSITKQFIIQKKVTTQDIAEIYNALFRVQSELQNSIQDLIGKLNLMIGLVIASFALSGGVFLWAKKNISKADSEFEQWLKTDVENVLLQEVAKLRKELEGKK